MGFLRLCQTFDINEGSTRYTKETMNTLMTILGLILAVPIGYWGFFQVVDWDKKRTARLHSNTPTYLSQQELLFPSVFAPLDFNQDRGGNPLHLNEVALSPRRIPGIPEQTYGYRRGA